ncbi:MAG: glycoside hydrolase family 3 C-terminal domain-containing protein [Christensenellales bacterium]
MADLEKILKNLTLEEKCALCSGIDFWHTTPIKDKGIESVTVSDGPHGLRKEKKSEADVANVMQESEKATCFPTAVTVASSWNVETVKKMAEAIAEEAIDQGVDVVLGPGINIKRNPLCGRNFEYFSEDPYLAGELGATYVKAMQDKHVGTSLKHFAVNSQEKRRMSVSSEVDERAFREIYLSAFENTVKKAQPYTVMCSYNPINGVYSSDNKYLLTDILRDEWGYTGIVVSDWGAVNDRVKGIVAGLDLQMPSDEGICDRDIAEAIKSGALKEEQLDKVVMRMLEFIDKCLADRVITGNKKCDYEAHAEIAAEIAADGAVLLKNDGALPLKKEEKLAVIGSLAKNMRYQGSGSSQINPYSLTSFTDYLDSMGEKYAYADGYGKSDVPDKEKIEEAKNIAKIADKALLFIGLTDEYESEGFDRTHLSLPASHNELIKEILSVNENVIIVLAGGSPVEMPWLNDVRAVLNMYLAGSAGGKACYKLLYGEVTPSGKLAETYPISLDSNPAYKYYQMGPQTVEYRESIYVGYRYFDKAKKDVLFPFGYGLSYTTFEYSDMSLSSDHIDENDLLTVSFTVTNTGTTDGAEVAQVYVRDVESTVFREDKALKGFVKVFLKAGESKKVSVELDRRSFAFYDVKKCDWTVESGEFEILVGASSRDLRWTKKVFVNGTAVECDCAEKLSSYYAPDKATDFPAEEFEALLGRKLTVNRPFKKGEIGYNATIGDLGVCWIGKLIKWAGYNFATIVLPKDTSESMKKMVKLAAMDMPLRNCYAMTNGMVPKKVIDGLIARCNEGPFVGWGRIFGGFFNKPQKKSEIYKN